MSSRGDGLKPDVGNLHTVRRMRLYRCRLDIRARHPASEDRRPSSNVLGFPRPASECRGGGGTLCELGAKCKRGGIPVRNPPHSFHVLGFDYVISNHRISGLFLSSCENDPCKCTLHWFASWSRGLLNIFASGVDPRKDLPKDAGHPKTHTAAMLEISNMIPLWAVGFLISMSNRITAIPFRAIRRDPCPRLLLQ